MPHLLTGATPPDGVTAAMLQGFGKFVAPQAVYVADIEMLSKKSFNLLDLAEFSGWRYMTLTGPDTAIAALVDQQSDETYAFSGLTAGTGICKAIRSAQRLRKRNDLGDYEIRALSIPALFIDCLWLRVSGGKDWIVPYSAGSPVVNLDRLYTVEEFVLAVAPSALKRFESKTGPEHAEPDPKYLPE